MASELRAEKDPLLRARIHKLASQAHAILGPVSYENGPGTHDGPLTSKTEISKNSNTSGRLSSDTPAETTKAGNTEAGKSRAADALVQADMIERQNKLIKHIQSLIDFAYEEADLAAELASLTGDMFSARGLMLLFDGSNPQVIQGHNMPKEDIDDISTTILEKVRTSRKPYSCPDVLADPELSQVRSLRVSHIRSVLCYPILQDNACVGVLYVDHPETNFLTSPTAMESMRQIAELSRNLVGALMKRKSPGTEPSDDFGLIGESEPMRRLFDELQMFAESRRDDLVVLFVGETGTGKSVIAPRASILAVSKVFNIF
jgi:transcriptional regulator with GAF, ATPase, and Fis domain